MLEEIIFDGSNRLVGLVDSSFVGLKDQTSKINRDYI